MIAERTFLLAISLMALLGLITISGCSPHLQMEASPQDSRYTPTNLDELDQAAERLLIAEAEQVDATAEMQAGPEVVW